MDQRSLFREFYVRVCTLDNVNGRVMGREVFNLLTNQTMTLKSYKEIEHKSYGTSAYFDIYLHVCKNGKQYYLNGILLLSMKYWNKARPVIILQRNKKLLLFNHQFLDPNGIVNTEFIRNWDSHPSVFDCIRDVVEQLQGDPYNYEKEEDDDDQAAEEEAEPEPEKPAIKTMPFDDHIPYTELKKGRQLGRGSFGIVYEAEWNGKVVAMKEWTANMDNEERQALKRGLNNLKNLNHPNCLRLYGLSETPSKRLVLVMELAECSLADITTQREKINKMHPERKPIPPLSNEDKCRIILEIAQGIQYIHSCGYYHCGINLENILMKDGHPKIADFGHAPIYDMNGLLHIFNPVYVAPELIMGKKVTNAVDCYAFGCIVNEIISNKTCYWDYKVRTTPLFFRDVCKGMTPTILPDTPDEVKYLLKDCYKSMQYRPPMNVLVNRISMWEPSKW